MTNTHPAPDLELLKDAYALIDGIPDDLIDLRYIVTSRGPDLSCGTIACAAGWIGLHPTFASRLNPKLEKLRGNHYGSPTHAIVWTFAGLISGDWELAMASLFNLTLFEAQKLFTVRGNSVYDQQLLPGWTDKQVWQHRVRLFLGEHDA